MALTDPEVPLAVGHSGVLNGKGVKVVSHLVIGMVEDGETYYWDEWELKTPAGEVMVLECDDYSGKWKLMREFSPSQKLTPQDFASLNPGNRIPIDSPQPMVKLLSRATVRSIEGAPTYEVSAGEETPYLDAGVGTKFYSVEWGKRGLDFYRGEAIAPSAVAAAFPEAKAAMAARAEVRKTAESWRMRAIWTGMACGFVAMCFGVHGAFKRGEQVAAIGAKTIADIPPEGVRYGPFQLKPEDGIYRLFVRSTLRESSAWVSAVVESADQEELEIAAGAGDMWDESGRDEDGPWHEAKMESSSDLVIKKAAPFYVRLYAEPDSVASKAGSASFEIQKGVIHDAYFWIYMGLSFCAVLALIFI